MLYIPALLAPSAKYQNTSDISYLRTFEDLCDTKLLLLVRVVVGVGIGGCWTNNVSVVVDVCWWKDKKEQPVNSAEQ